MLEIADLFSAIPPVLWHRELQVSDNTMCRFQPTYVTPSRSSAGGYTEFLNLQSPRHALMAVAAWEMHMVEKS